MTMNTVSSVQKPVKNVQKPAGNSSTLNQPVLTFKIKKFKWVYQRDKKIIKSKTMGVIAKDDQKITLYYNSETSLGKQTYAYVTSSDRKILAVDISKTNVTGTQWTEIADNLNKNVSDLIDQEHPDFVKQYGDSPVDMDQHNWLKLLEKHPEVLTYPIAINGNQYLEIKNPSDFSKFLDVENPSSKQG